MMIMKKMYFLLLTLFLVCVIGCSNDTHNVLDCNAEELKENPYDYLGEIHNACMDSIKEIGIAESELSNYVIGFIERRKTIFNITNIRDIRNYREICDNTLKIGRNMLVSKTRGGDVVDSILQKIPLSWKSYVVTLLEIVDNSYEDTVSLRKDFFIVDNKIMNDKNLSNTDKDCLLCSSSVAKASYIYNKFNVKTRSSNKGDNIVKSDLLGALGGVVEYGLAGTSTGLVFGPGGIALGLIGGAGLGAMISSGFSGIFG